MTVSNSLTKFGTTEKPGKAISRDVDNDIVDAPKEFFRLYRRGLKRTVIAGEFTGTSVLPTNKNSKRVSNQRELRKNWWQSRLRGVQPLIDVGPKRQEINVIDICSGAGGLASGIKWACEAVGVRPVFQACIDVDINALTVYQNNVRPLRTCTENIANLVKYHSTNTHNPLGFPTQPNPVITNSDLNALQGKIEIAIAGPPCEGNSNFNNVTRRIDRRNELYVASVACAIALEAKVVIVENVVSVKRARQDVVERAKKMLASAGYFVNNGDGVLKASCFGTPQNRRRHFLIASMHEGLNFDEYFAQLESEPITTMEAIGDLVDIDALSSFDRASQLSPENAKRVRYLIENDVWNLPDSERPACHQSGTHSYPSVYGRIRPDEPVQTITTGFLSPGRGRFAHPNLPRGLTPHEGARLQGFPDDFRFCSVHNQLPNRNALSSLIGGAVPPQLGYVTGLVALSKLRSENSH